MKQEELRADAAYRRRTGHYDKPAIAAKNQLEQNFDVEAPDQTRVTDITYIRTHEDWLYLAAAPDPFSRQVIGRSTHPPGSPHSNIITASSPGNACADHHPKPLFCASGAGWI